MHNTHATSFVLHACPYVNTRVTCNSRNKVVALRFAKDGGVVFQIRIIRSEFANPSIRPATVIQPHPPHPRSRGPITQTALFRLRWHCGIPTNCSKCTYQPRLLCFHQDLEVMTLYSAGLYLLSGSTLSHNFQKRRRSIQ
jgi:hypothetical protein